MFYIIVHVPSIFEIWCIITYSYLCIVVFWTFYAFYLFITYLLHHDFFLFYLFHLYLSKVSNSIRDIQGTFSYFISPGIVAILYCCSTIAKWEKKQWLRSNASILLRWIDEIWNILQKWTCPGPKHDDLSLSKATAHVLKNSTFIGITVNKGRLK